MDVIFRSPCYEGDELLFQRKPSENALDFRASKDGATVLLARIMQE